MDEIKIKNGMIIKNQTDYMRYRIVYITETHVLLCQVDTSKLNLFQSSIKYVIDNISDHLFSIEEDEFPIFDFSSLNEKAKKKYEENLQFIHDVNDIFGPSYIDLCTNSSTDKSKQLMDKYHFSKSKYWRLIRKYLQSGMSLYSLVDQRHLNPEKNNYNYKKKTGRHNNLVEQGILIDSKVKGYFDEAIKHYKSGRHKSFKNVYDKMIFDHYTYTEKSNGEINVLYYPITEYPTYDQFYYYAHKQLSKSDMKIIKTSKQEYRNNHRLLLSDSLNGVLGPGYLVEMDEVETDISLVSELDPGKCIGRAVIYVMIDVYTRVILAISVALENNCIQGFTNCMINLAEDKEKYCNKFDVQYNPLAWPSNIIPKRMRFDRGSEYRSKETKRILNSLGIEFSFAPAGTGSMKGVIEQLFHQFNCVQNTHVENKGLITKRHDSKHHQQSTLTLSEMTKITLAQVLAHNIMSMNSYKMTTDMIKNKVSPTPISLWKYGCEVYGYPRPIANLDQYSYDIMTEINTAKLSRSGIIVDGLYYINDSDKDLFKEMANLGNKSVKFDCRMDTRDVGTIYYIRKNKLMVAQLNPLKTGNSEYKGMTRKEYLAIRELRKQIDADNKHRNQCISSDRQAVIENVVKAATKRKNHYSSTKNMRQNRAEERENLESHNTISSRLLDDSEHVIESQKTISTHEKAETPPYLEAHTSTSDAFAAFWEDENNKYFD